MANLIDLSTEREPLTICVDGVTYPIRDRESMSLVETLPLIRLGKIMQAAAEQSDMSEEEARAVDDARLAAFRLIAPEVPESVSARLTPAQITAVLGVFLLRPPTADATGQTSPSSGASSGGMAGA